MSLTIGSLFSGIGGVELGLEACGLGPVIWQCDSDPDARTVLAKHWPDMSLYQDVAQIDETVRRPDIVCGGFPCQDISDAGTSKVRNGIYGKKKAGYGVNLQGSSGFSVPDGSSSKTLPRSPNEGSTKSFRRLPRWGSMRNGVVSAGVGPALRTHEKDCSYLPAPTATANQTAPSMAKWPGCKHLQDLFGEGSQILPAFWEWEMGFPAEWTACVSSGTLRSRR